MRDPSLELDGSDDVESEQATAADVRLGRMVEQHFDFIWRLLRRAGVPHADAEDRAQEVFMIAHSRIDQIARGSERTFLYGTALRVAANARRTLRRRREVAQTSDERLSTTTPPDAASELGRAVELLDRLLEQLPPKLRRVLVLAEVEELEVAEIAKLEGLKLGTAASRLRRARTAFREALASVPHPFREDP